VFGILAGPLFSIINYFGWLMFDPILPLMILSVIYMLYLGIRLFFKFPFSPGLLVIITSSFLYIGLPILLLTQFVNGQEPTRLIINIILLIWISDTFAYFTGSLIGKNKLMPKISPGKTIEGALGGLLFTVGASILMFNLWPLGGLYLHIGLAMVVWFFGLAGDLVESQLKRYYGIKDSGTILPGHGGFLDRFDSFIYLIPFALLYLKLYG